MLEARLFRAFHSVAEPRHRVAPNFAVAFRYVCPTYIISESDKHAQGALIRTRDKYDFVAFAKCGGNRFRVSHFAEPFVASREH